MDKPETVMFPDISFFKALEKRNSGQTRKIPCLVQLIKHRNQIKAIKKNKLPECNLTKADSINGELWNGGHYASACRMVRWGMGQVQAPVHTLWLDIDKS